MGHNSKRNSDEQKTNPDGYATQPPSPWWPRGVLASAHINRLMIIVKGENQTHNNQTSKRV